MNLSPLASALLSTIRRDPVRFAASARVALRPYQRRIALAIKDSIIHHRGLTFVVILPRQSGKNELQAHIFAWLLFRAGLHGGAIVSVSPTFKPQTTNNMQRVAAVLDVSLGTRGLWKSSSGFIYRFGKARLQFFSGEPSARVVGATASLLLSVDEAQDISIRKFDKDFDPMTASTNATRVFWGTAWTSDTLLERERRYALRAQQQDGIQRLFYYTGDDIRRFVPSYGCKMDEVITKNGRNHPLVRTQYFCETLDAQFGMFNPARLLLLDAGRPPLPPEGEFGMIAGFPLPPGDASCISADSPLPLGEGPGVGAACAFLIDVAGQDETKINPLLQDDQGLGNPGRDSTTLSIVAIDLSTLETLRRPTYHVIARRAWTGESHLAVFGQLKNLAQNWSPGYIVIDATGVGEGLWALLDRFFPGRVLPVKFNRQEKSEIGWRFISIIETGCFRDHCHTDQVHLQYTHCLSEILPGSAKTLRWGVPDGARGPAGGLIHDDFILADALVAKLDELEWHISSPALEVVCPDPLLNMDRSY